MPPNTNAAPSSPTRYRSRSASDPQCSALLEDGVTQCPLPGTNGNPEKPERRCKAHNELYQNEYRVYKEAGTVGVQIKTSGLQGRIPNKRDLDRMGDIPLLEDKQRHLEIYREAVEKELDLRMRHTTQFMLTQDAGHDGRLERLREERRKVDDALFHLLLRKEELSRPSQPPPGRRERVATSVATRVTPSVRPSHSSRADESRGYRRGDSETHALSSYGQRNAGLYHPYERPAAQPIPKPEDFPPPSSYQGGTETTRRNPGTRNAPTYSSQTNMRPTYAAAASSSNPYQAQQTNQQVYTRPTRPQPKPERYVQRPEPISEPRAVDYPRASHGQYQGYRYEPTHEDGRWPNGDPKDEESSIFGFNPLTVLGAVTGLYLAYRYFSR